MGFAQGYEGGQGSGGGGAGGLGGAICAAAVGGERQRK